MKIGIVITDGVGFRNFILSDFIAESQQAFEKIVIFSCLPISAYEGLNLNVEIIELPIFEEKFKTWFFRKCKEVAHLQLNKKNNFGIQDNLKANYTVANSPRGWATRRIFWFTNFFNSEFWILRFEKFQQFSFKNNFLTKEYSNLLQQHKIELLFFSHQRPPYIAPLIYAAQKLKIKTSAFVFSWDNLASKGRMAGTFDHYLVWSDLMKRELQEFYSSVNENQISVIGTPQFEPYVLDRYGYEKNAFFEKFDLDLSKKLLLFSCGDVSTSPNDPVYIESIANAIANSELKNVQLLVRTSPAESPERFSELAQKYPFVKWNYPKWIQTRSSHQESWSQRIPSVEDVSDLKSVLKYCDICVNMLSTMSLDAMLFEKPVINTVFGDGNNGLVNDQRFLNYAHIEKVVQSGSVIIAKDDQSLIDSVNFYLVNPEANKVERRKLINLQISVPIEKTSERIVLTLQNLK